MNAVKLNMIPKPSRENLATHGKFQRAIGPGWIQKGARIGKIIQNQQKLKSKGSYSKQQRIAM